MFPNVVMPPATAAREPLAKSSTNCGGPPGSGKTNLIYAWLGTIGAEYFMPSDGGIASLMIGAQQLFRMDQVMAAMVLIGLVGALLGNLGQRLESRATRWRTA